MNNTNNTRGTASGTPKRSDAVLPTSVNTRERTSAKKPHKRNSKAKSLLNEEESISDASSIDSTKTVVANNTTPVKTVVDVAPPKDGDDPPKDGDDAPHNHDDGDVIQTVDRNGDGVESTPKQPTYDMDTQMFHASPLGPHSYSNWIEYFNEVWEAQSTRSVYLKEHISGQVKEMVNLCKEISMREETTANNSNPAKNVDGSEPTFNPSRPSRKRKPTAKPSTKYADATRMKDFEERSRLAAEKEWKRKEDEKIEKAKLVLLCSLEDLQARIWNTASTIASYALSQKTQRMSRRVRAIQGEYNLVVDSSYMSKVIAYFILVYAIKNEDAKFLGAKSTNALLDTFEKNNKFKADDFFTKIYDDQGNFRDENARYTKFKVEEITNEWEEPFRELTIKVLYLADDLFAAKLSMKSGDETLKKLLTKQATSDTQDALDEVDEDTQLLKPVKSFIQAEAGRQVNKATQKKLDHMRKNIWAMPKRRTRHRGPEKMVKVQEKVQARGKVAQRRKLHLHRQQNQL